MFDTFFRFDNKWGVQTIPHKIWKSLVTFYFWYHFAQNTSLNKF